MTTGEAARTPNLLGFPMALPVFATYGIVILGVTFALYENLSPGYGYTAIAVALLAGLRPVTVLWSSVLLGALAAGAAAMQRDAGVPAGAAAVAEAVLILALLAGQVLVGRASWRFPRLTTPAPAEAGGSSS